MENRIEQALSVLVGLPLWDSGRAADLQWFHFGKSRTVITRKGTSKEVGDYALHVQCAWRILASDSIVVGSSDLYYPPGNPRDRPDDFDWEVPEGNRRDQRIRLFMQEHAAQPLVVTSVEADKVGSIRLSLTHGYSMEVFPDDSVNDEYSEHWRLFQPSTETEHFVITGRGIET